jgi:hypothetical protein
MIEYFKSQIDKFESENKEKFKLFYFIEFGNFGEGLSFEMKSIDSSESDSFDFSNLELSRIGTPVLGVSLPVFKYKEIGMEK